MRLSGKLTRGPAVVKDAVVEINDENAAFRDLLEKCLINLCKELDIAVPMWLKKNTNEFIQYRRTFFNSDQFIESIGFDKFEIALEG